MNRLSRAERESRRRNWKRPENWPSNRRPKFVEKPWGFYDTGHDDYIDPILPIITRRLFNYLGTVYDI